MHYVCMGGCGAVVSEPGACAEPHCRDFKKPLHRCSCPDGHSHEQFIEVEDIDEGPR